VPESKPGCYWLVGLEEKTRAVRLPVDTPLLIGRGKYNHVVIDDSRLSRQHSRVAPEGDACVVYDLNSANGTFVNGVSVTRHVLSPNDLISFGPCVFRIEREAPESTVDSPAVDYGEEPTLTELDCHVEPVMTLGRRLEHDLALAAQIQKSFLPREVIAVEGMDLYAEYRAAYGVGGDFYDVFWVGPNRLAAFIGDISGKGISGALLMARISSELRVAALALVDPVAVLTAMNTATLGRGQPELFFTAVYLTLDVQTGEVLLANAGHTTPYSRRADGSIEPITAGRACAVGILDDPSFTATSLRLDHGDSLILYTDGVVEAAGADGSLYGQARLEACLAQAGARPYAIAEEILRGVEQHTARGSVRDDLTLFICQRSVGTAPTMQPRRRSSSFPAPPVPRTS
jgi:hypothetical protein